MKFKGGGDKKGFSGKPISFQGKGGVFFLFKRGCSGTGEFIV